MKHFNQYFTLEQFKEIYTYQNSPKEIDDEWRKNHDKLMNQGILPALDNFLKDYNKEVGLRKITNETGHRTNFGHFWNNYIDQNKKEIYEGEYLRELDTFIHKTLFYTVYHSGAEPATEVAIQDKYTKFTDTVNSGNFEKFNMSDSHYCFGCGENFCMEVKGWQPQFIKRSLDYNHKLQYTVAEPCAVEPIIELSVNFSSGRLLLSDWFRIPQFTNAVDDNHKNDVNSSLGRINLTKYHAENFNFIAAPSSGSPYIFQQGDKLVFAQVDEDKPSFKKFTSNYTDHGRINSGLRAITIIDEDQLLAIMTKQLGEEDAKKALENYLEENDYEITRVTVTPGTYQFKFSGDCYKFKENLIATGNKEDKFPKAIEPFLIVQNLNLILDNKPKKPKMK